MEIVKFVAQSNLINQAKTKRNEKKLKERGREKREEYGSLWTTKKSKKVEK